MSISCPHCASLMPDTAAFCPGCGHTMLAATKAHGMVGVFPENIAGALAYVTFIPAILFLLLEPYRRDRFVRFHSFQCLFFWLAIGIVGTLLRLVALIFLFVPVLAPLFAAILWMVVVLGSIVLWFVLLIKALQGEIFKLPMVGDLAERQAAATAANYSPRV